MATVLLVDFLPDGRCNVTSGAGRLSTGLATGATPGSGAAAGRAADLAGAAARGGGTIPSGLPAGRAFRCPVPFAQFGNRSVDLRVVLPDGIDRSDSAFPRLDWRHVESHWIGSASLPSAPAFVSLRPSPPDPSAAGFGWNFYGFFVFAVAFIAAYFLWARRMARPGDRGGVVP